MFVFTPEILSVLQQGNELATCTPGCRPASSSAGSCRGRPAWPGGPTGRSRRSRPRSGWGPATARRRTPRRWREKGEKMLCQNGNLKKCIIAFFWCAYHTCGLRGERGGFFSKIAAIIVGQTLFFTAKQQLEEVHHSFLLACALRMLVEREVWAFLFKSCGNNCGPDRIFFNIKTAT